MKKIKIIILFLLLTGWGAQQLSAQALLKGVTGKWKVIKYQDKSRTQSLADTLEFQPDGTFLSDSIYFKPGKGLFRTDENRSVLILNVRGKATEWRTSIKNGVLRMRSVSSSKKQPRVYITSVRIKES
jgi:hypothetical protein